MTEGKRKVNRMGMTERFKMLEFIKSHTKYGKAQLTDDELAKRFEASTGIKMTSWVVSSVRRAGEIKAYRERNPVSSQQATTKAVVQHCAFKPKDINVLRELLSELKTLNKVLSRKEGRGK